MKTYIFTGKVLPERANVSLHPWKMELPPPIGGIARIHISISQISVWIDTDTTIDIFTFKNSIENLVRVMVDSYGYISGCGYDIEITSVIDSEGKNIIFGVGIPDIENQRDKRPLSYEEVCGMALGSKSLQGAFFNLREAIRMPTDTGFFCYRAVESIRQDFKMHSKNDRESWDKLRGALRISREYFSYLESYATPTRHGDIQDLTDEQRSGMMNRAWTIVDRYIIYLKAEKLLGDSYPIL